MTEYLLLRGVAGILCVVPRRAALACGWVLAWFSHHVLRFRAATARARIRSVFGDAFPPRAVRRIAWISWRNLCFNVVELARMPRLDEAAVRAMYLDPEAPGRMMPRGGGGCLVAVPHAGNWDLAGVSCHLLGMPMFFIARRQKNPLTDAFLNRMRGTTGVETVLNDSRVLKSVIRNLKQGKILAILPDVRAPTPALRIRFLGGEANIGAGMALFARQTGVPILPAAVRRIGWDRHDWQAFAPVHPDPSLPKEEDWQRMTQAVMDHFDAAIRAAPEQYFWYNKRWVLDPPPPPRIP